jgi:hypothetical protein
MAVGKKQLAVNTEQLAKARKRKKKLEFKKLAD